ncbi:cytochrome b5-like [Sesamum indicum]|uniref:Cytochrome b5-like n=1 Tax=Sesamum indicum TaxID=4182 RepID=A0A6I9TYP7_SESIN|nr:cytochrome b5-like [Sesamum indicum]
MAKVFTFDEVAQHNTREDCWLVLFEKAYDVTAFIDEHPGGDDLLLNVTGKDATPEFKAACHTFNAWSMMERLYVGEVDKSTIPFDNTTTTPLLQTLAKKGKDTTTTTPSSQLLNTKGNNSNKYLIYLLQFLVPLIIVNLAVAFFSKSSA